MCEEKVPWQRRLHARPHLSSDIENSPGADTENRPCGCALTGSTRAGVAAWHDAGGVVHALSMVPIPSIQRGAVGKVWATPPRPWPVERPDAEACASGTVARGGRVEHAVNSRTARDPSAVRTTVARQSRTTLDVGRDDPSFPDPTRWSRKSNTAQVVASQTGLPVAIFPCLEPGPSGARATTLRVPAAAAWLHDQCVTFSGASAR